MKILWNHVFPIFERIFRCNMLFIVPATVSWPDFSLKIAVLLFFRESTKRTQLQTHRQQNSLACIATHANFNSPTLRFLLLPCANPLKPEIPIAAFDLLQMFLTDRSHLFIRNHGKPLGNNRIALLARFLASVIQQKFL